MENQNSPKNPSNINNDNGAEIPNNFSRFQVHFALKKDNRRRCRNLMPLTKSYVKGMYRYLDAHNIATEELEMVYRMLLTQGERSDAKKLYPEAAYTHNRKEYCDRILEGATRKSPAEWFSIVCKHILIVSVYLDLLAALLFFLAEGTASERLLTTMHLNLPALLTTYLVLLGLYLLLQRLLACSWMPSLIKALYYPLTILLYFLLFLPLSGLFQAASFSSPLWPLWALPPFFSAVYRLSLRYLLRGRADIDQV